MPTIKKFLLGKSPRGPSPSPSRPGPSHAPANPSGAGVPALAPGAMQPASNHNPTGTELAGVTIAPSNVLSRSSIVSSPESISGTLPMPAHAAEDQPSNPQSPAAPVPAKKGAFEIAIQNFVKGLSDDDKEAFKSSSDIMEKLQKMQDDPGSRISSSLPPRVKNILQFVQKFMGSIGILIQHSPEISSLVVGGVNCILTVRIVDFVHQY